MRIAAILIAVLLLGTVFPARADFERDRRHCSGHADPGVRAQACTRLIQSARFDGEALATIYRNRGNAYRIDGRHEQAIQDFDHAIRLNGGDGKAFAGRGFAYEKIGRADQALEDYKEAYRLGFRVNFLVKKIRELGARKR